MQRALGRSFVLLLGLAAVAAPWSHAGDPPPPPPPPPRVPPPTRTPAAPDEPAMPAPALTDAERAFFAWWDGLRFPDVTSLPFVRVWQGRWTQTANADPMQRPTGAFLVRNDRDAFTVFHTDLSMSRLVRTGPDAKPWNRIAFEPLDLLAFVERGLGAATRADEDPDQRFRWARVRDDPESDPFDAHRWSTPDQTWRLAILARACAARGRDDLAARLLALLQKQGLSRVESQRDEYAPVDDPYRWVRQSVGYEAHRRLEEATNDDSLSWDDLVAATILQVERFPPDDRTYWDRRIATLRSLADEMRARREHPGRPWAECAEPERIERLIRDLPNVGGPSADDFGSTDVEGTRTPAGAIHRLEEIGLPAVPALIAALDDERPTRVAETVFSFHGDRRDELDIQCVGDLAWSVLKTIACGSLGPPETRFHFMMREDRQGEESRARATSWYESVRRRGEAVVVAEEVRRGSDTSIVAAGRLAKLDPKAAIEALEAGVDHAEESWPRDELVRRLAELDGDAPVEALRRLLNGRDDPEARTPIARALWKRGRREGLEVLIGIWRRIASTGPGVPVAITRGSPGDLRAAVLQALSISGDPEAIRALCDGLGRRPPNERLDVVMAFVRSSSYSASGRDVSTPTPGAAQEEEQPPSEDTQRAIETLLAERLEDAAEIDGLHMSIGGIDVAPIVGEVAAWALVRRDPGHWSFDADAPADARRRARVVAANRWRASHGRDPLPLPPLRTAPPALPASEIDADWNRLVGEDAGARTEAARSLEAKGLAALPPLRARLASLASDARARPAVVAIVKRLSFVVAEAGFTGDSVPPDEALRTLVHGTKGTRFSGAMFRSILLYVASHLGEGLAGVHLGVERESADAGISIRATLLRVPGRSSPGWTFLGPDIRRGRTWSGGGNASISRDYGLKDTEWDDAVRTIDHELEEATSDERFTVDARFRATR